MNKTIFDRAAKCNDKDSNIKAVAILFSDGTVDTIDEITGCTFTTSYDNSEEGISVIGKYHAFAYNKDWITEKCIGLNRQ